MTPDSQWQPFLELLRREDATPPIAMKEGGWKVSVACSLHEIDHFLDRAPGSFTELERREQELLDAYGQGVDIECTSGIFASPDQRALLDWHEHWQAGLFFTLSVFSDTGSWERAQAELLADTRAE